jgi:hypothetical protein
LRLRGSRIRSFIKAGLISWFAVTGIYAAAALSMWGLSLTFLRVMLLVGAAVFVGIALVALLVLSMSHTSAGGSD